MRIQQSRPLGQMPDYSTIKEESIRKWVKDLVDILLKEHRNIYDDIKNLQNIDMVDLLPTYTSEYRGRLFLLKGVGTGLDRLYIGIGTGGSGFKLVTIT